MLHASLLDRFAEVDLLVDGLMDLTVLEQDARLSTLEDAALARMVRDVLSASQADTLDLAAEHLPRLEASAELDEDARSKSGDRVGAWELGSVLGEGGMGVVYAAHRADGAYEQRAAVKFVRLSASPDAQRRFERERRLLAQVEHAGVARVLDGGVTDAGDPFLVMEYVDGEPITQWADARRLSIRQRIGLMQQVCAAVSHAHSRLIVHRDVKPSNVLVTDGGTPKLLDFGVATLAEGDDEWVTQHAAPLTPSYASPEQIRGEGATTQSDVYALGVLLYELLCGARPHAGADRHTLTTSVLTRDAPRPSNRVTAKAADARGTTAKRLRASLRGDLDAICQRAVAREPSRRYTSVQALADDLTRHLDGQTVSARPPSPGYRARMFARRNRTGVAFAILALVGILLFVGVLIDRQDKLTTALATATLERDKATEVSRFLADLFADDADVRNARTRDMSALDMVRRGAARIDTALAAQPHVQADLQHELGRILKDLGAYDESIVLHQRAHDTRARLFGPADVRTARSLREMGIAFQRAGRFAEADSVLRIAHGIFRSTLTPPDFDLAQSYNELGMVALDRSDYAAAETLFAAYRDQHEQMSGPVSDPIARSLNQNGLVLAELGRPDEALPMLREALRVWDIVHGPGNERSSAALNNVGYALGGMGQLDSAYHYLDRSLQVKRQVFEGDHPSVASQMLNVGANRMLARDYAQADSLLTASLAMYERTVGPGHRKALQTLSFVIRNRTRMGDTRPAQTIALLDTLMARQIVALGDDHVDVASTYRTRARAHADAGDYGRALADIDRAIELARARVGELHARVRDYTRVRARIHGQFARYDRAEADFATVVRLTEAAGAIESDPNFHARTLWDRSGMRMQSGRAAESLPDLRDAARLWGELGNARSVADVEARIAEIRAGRS